MKSLTIKMILLLLLLSGCKEGVYFKTIDVSEIETNVTFTTYLHDSYGSDRLRAALLLSRNNRFEIIVDSNQMQKISGKVKKTVAYMDEYKKYFLVRSVHYKEKMIGYLFTNYIAPPFNSKSIEVHFSEQNNKILVSILE